MNTSKTQRFLGWYQLIAAAIGALFTSLAYWRTGAFTAESLILGAAPFTVVGTAGLWLLKGRPMARVLTIIAQLLQVPIISLPWLTWKFVAGLIISLTLSKRGASVYTGIETTWLIAARHLDQSSIGFNVVPMIVIVVLLRACRRQP